jgi:hypothetical protein
MRQGARVVVLTVLAVTLSWFTVASISTRRGPQATAGRLTDWRTSVRFVAESVVTDRTGTTTVRAAAVLDVVRQRVRITGSFQSPRGPAQVEERLVDGYVYAKLRDPSGPVYFRGKQWGKFRRDQVLPGLTLKVPDALKVLLSSRRQSMGHEKIRGVVATHYRLLVDPPTAGSVASASSQSIDAFGSGLQPAQEDVWVDRHQLLLRRTLNVHSDSVSQTVRYDYFDYGARVKIRKPRPRAVSDATDIPFVPPLGALV